MVLTPSSTSYFFWADDDTLVDSLYDSHPNVMAKIASLLDEEVPGKPNWKDLADAFDVPQRESDNFGESIDVNPAERLFEYLKATKPGLTIVKIKQHLENLKMQDVLDVLAQSKKGWFSVVSKIAQRKYARWLVTNRDFYEVIFDEAHRNLDRII